MALPPAVAQPSSTVVITASREPMRAEAAAADLVVIDAERIAASPADSLADLLRREAGVQLARTGGPGQSTGVLIRGSAAVNTLVLIDGVRVGSATLGQAAFEAIGRDGIERIEVLRGPGSALYGSEAVGGVVQIVTKRGAGAPTAALRFAAGAHGLQEAGATLGGAAGAFDASLALARERSRGVSALRAGDAFGSFNPDRDGFARTSANATLGFTPAAGHRIGLLVNAVRLDAQYDASQFLPPTFAPDATPDFRNRQRTALTALDWRGVLAPSLTATLRASQASDRVVTGAGAPDTFDTERRQASAQLAFEPARGQQWIAALERLAEDAASSSYAGPASRRTDALALAWNGQAGAFAWQLDARHDDRSDTESATTGRAGAAWALGSGWRLRALAGTAFRAPSFNDLVFPGYGVPGLAPERSRSLEAGLGWRRGAQEANLTWYRNRVRDLIGYEPDRSRCPPDPAYDFGCASNVARATLRGVSLVARGAIGSVAADARFEWLAARDEASGARLNGRAARQGHVGLDWAAGDALALGAVLNHLGERPSGGATLASETTLDLRTHWRFAPGWRLEATLRNATDRRQEPVRDYQGPGREWVLGLRWTGGLPR